MAQLSLQLGCSARCSALAALLAVLIVSSASPAWAQPAAGPPQLAPPHEIDEAVAAALFDRGQLLFAKGDLHNAKKLFVEAIGRSPEGAWADKSLAMLRSTNERLGIRDLEHGAPRVEKAPTADEPLDPYAGGGSGGTRTSGSAGAAPVDPYGEGGAGGAGGAGENVVDPYADGGGPGGGGGAIAPPTGGKRVDTGPPSARTMRNRVLFSGAVWGAYNGALLGDLMTGIDTSSDGAIAGFMLGGALVGAGAGYLYAKKSKPEEDDLAVINSMGLYGTAAGLLLGVGFDPIESEAYSLQALLGSVAGLGGGFYLARKLEISRKRTWRIDLGALAGVAATWALFYPLVSDDSTNNDEQAAGFISVAAMGGGAFVAYLLTRKMDRKPAEPKRSGPAVAPIAGVIIRSPDGEWGVGGTVVRPMVNPVLTGQTRGPAWGVDLLGGRF